MRFSRLMPVSEGWEGVWVGGGRCGEVGWGGGVCGREAGHTGR